MKIILIIFLLLVIVVGGVVYHYRHEIFQFSAETVIKKNLPPYVIIERIIFDLKEGSMQVKGLGIKNPKGYGSRYLANIDSILCTYEMQGENILDGIEVTGIETKGGIINIERLANGRLNVNEMEGVMKAGLVKEKKKEEGKEPAKEGKKGEKRFEISKLVKLTDTINIRNGKVIFVDKAVGPRSYMLTFDDINTDLVIQLNEDYTDVISVASDGSGVLNGDARQLVEWTISLDPKTPELTMSNRFEASDVDITLFEPYYYKYSPIEIYRGRFWGTLIFDFDNGNIGSINTLRLRDLKFAQKKGNFGAQFWDVAITDIIKYLQTSPGEVTFDFKIKGTMEHPRFYPGPVVKNAIQSMVVDKVSEYLMEPEGKEGGAKEKTDAEVVMDILEGLMKK